MPLPGYSITIKEWQSYNNTHTIVKKRANLYKKFSLRYENTSKNKGNEHYRMGVFLVAEFSEIISTAVFDAAEQKEGWPSG